MPEDDTGADRHIKGVLRTELRYLQTEVGRIHHILTHAFDFIAEDHGIFPARFRNKSVKHDGSYGLLCTDYRIPLILQTEDSVKRIIDMLPCHAVFRTKSRLMDLC